MDKARFAVVALIWTLLSGFNIILTLYKVLESHLFNDSNDISRV